ncbi:MAG: hypothetical protein ACE5DW_00655 [Thermodesulfobacteriota bacterium]
MRIETVEALPPVEVYKNVVGAWDCNKAQKSARHVSLESDYEAEEMRAGVDEVAVESAKEGVVNQAEALKGDLNSKGISSLEAMEGITAEHRRLWDKVRKKLVAGLCKRDLNKGLEQLKVAKLAGDILSVVVKGQRQAWGLDVLEGELRCDDTEEFIEEMASLTVPSRADKALD